MSFLTSHMEAMLWAATDPEEIEMRRRVLDDHLAMQKELSEKNAALAALEENAVPDKDQE